MSDFFSNLFRKGPAVSSSPRPPTHQQPTSPQQPLTPQQQRVLQMLRQGMLNKQIAHELDVGETTVKAHVSEILRKLHVASRTQAVIEMSKIDFDTVMAAGAQGQGGR